MGSIVGRYDKSVEEEVNRVWEWLRSIGIDASKVEVSAFVIAKGRQAKATEKMAKDFFGLRRLRK